MGYSSTTEFHFPTDSPYVSQSIEIANSDPVMAAASAQDLSIDSTMENHDNNDLNHLSIANEMYEVDNALNALDEVRYF